MIVARWAILLRAAQTTFAVDLLAREILRAVEREQIGALMELVLLKLLRSLKSSEIFGEHI